MLRKATIDDAGKIGAVHVAAWKETYDDLLPRDMLDGLSVEVRSAMWAKILSDPSAFAETSVYAVEDTGSVVGFGACGRQRDSHLRELGFDGEISAIYMLRSQQRKGFGLALMHEMAMELRSREFEAAALWVLRDNKAAREFYRYLGGQVVAEKEEKRENAVLLEVAYGWHGLAPLIERP
ncbi:ribosomal protein S18 acetylase RimI-like enzyme [Rhizobium leguminosarum]|uniref:Ribosomal protein S18 acetylase RimI-like enzyme n=1 Tax=Rhizobium leguminosarum TaxID=384 RepID=A0AAE2MJF2_RHILE|nr:MULTISPECIES: GNAT family N-acetyltransferase [Rhizobium]MBB4290536.1 ribosomal protein S18 acetylase RimI-like enzyme [Rhizobium leguminosarum]MBB4297187.1 ribosomal protein S18 acetylase RimI-like enzyme [Rhizobium leguminosarum]MBB4307559.1 ribosomal protein S18 acetylase RimI-like enzyme [Rhizobium leguminosarum]MBB4415387.1 ribosomal protein S18 acetylase RimI-like enzyme [Rhizobium leguminosarum]MBB4431646.1 ribosomal protein S18 acetylase RimI-like enzyme [Rhizobium esperanzae]